jgi:putative ABC transport system ATP-binding protein
MMQLGAPLVLIENLSKSYALTYGTVHALKKVDLKISPGQSLAIMGPSGSGKSTLLHILGCLDRPTEGRYLLNGHDLSSCSDAELSLLRASKIGFVFQSYNLISQLNLFENIEVPFHYQQNSLSEKETRERILYAIERVNLLHRMYHLPSQLSGGEAQRTAIARALAIQPFMILADEPTGNLDRETGESILKLLQELNAQGSTLIIVTHDEEVATYCQRFVRMQDGFVVQDSDRN